MNRLLSTLALAATLGGCAAAPSITPPPVAPGHVAAITVSPQLPDDSYLPEQSAAASGTHYVVVQAEGGSLLLGPILGGLNIAAKTREMAERYKGSVFAIDPTPAATTALVAAGVPTGTGSDAFVVRPFVFVQHCDDERFRLLLVFHVEQPAAKWVRRYDYALPTSYPVAEFGALSPDALARYQAEVDAGSAVLADLVKRDLAGQLPTIRQVKVGSLYLIGNKMGAMGMYTQANERFVIAQLLEETDAYVTLRVAGNLHATGVFGGLLPGVHRIDKKLLFRFEPM